VGIPALQIDGAKRPSTEYEVTGKRAVRSQPHGCEYRTPASSLIPELACALHVTAYCCIMKWETLAEGETFEFSINDTTNIPTIEAYRALDITEDKRYTPHLEEFWNWVNKKDGRKIDPKRDCLHFWIENRKEVKPVPGLKINWASNIFPRSNKDTFVELASFDKISDISVYIIQPVENEEDIIAHICCPSEVGRSLNKSRLEKLKIKYGISGISGFNNTTVKLGVSQALINKTRTAKALQKMVIAFAEELYR
jgi:hypothetical protein